jgi:hypothetical protein
MAVTIGVGALYSILHVSARRKTGRSYRVETVRTADPLAKGLWYTGLDCDANGRDHRGGNCVGDSEQSTETCIGFRVSGKVSGKDYEELLPEIDKAIAAHGTISMLVLVQDFQGAADLDAARKDFGFGTRQYRQVERCAFVSDRAWHKWVVKLMDPFTRRTAEAFFEQSQLQDAWDWACGDG